MSYRVVVEIPEDVASNSKDAVRIVREMLEGRTALALYNRQNTNPTYWLDKVKTYSRVRGAERAQTEKAPIIAEVTEISDRLTELANRLIDWGFELQQGPMQDQLKKEEREERQAERKTEGSYQGPNRREEGVWHGRTAMPLRRSDDPL